MAILALGLAGAGLTSAIGIGASVGWLGGVIVGNLLFGGKGQNQEGPRLSDLSVQTSTYGAAVPLVYGTMRLAGNIIWSTPLKETRHVQHQRGGKGGGGGATQTTYSYSVSFGVGLCAGPVSTVRRIWADTKLIYDATTSNTQATEKYPGVVRIHTGDESQLPDSTIEMALGVGNVPAYRGLCYLVFTDLQLADFANRIPNISAEVVGAGGLQCNAVVLTPASDMFREGGWVDPARGVLIGQGANHIFKYDLVNNRLLLDVAVPSYYLYGTLCGIDSQGYYYHASYQSGIGMQLIKRHPDSLAVVAKSVAGIPLAPSGAVRRDKVFSYYSRRVYNSDLVEIADLSAVFPSHSAPGSPMCDDPFGNYWQVDSSKIRRYDGSLTEWSVSAWTGGEGPRAIFWDDTTGHLYFTLGLGSRIVKWHPDDRFAGYVDGAAIPAGFGIQSDGNMPVNGKLWAAAGITATLVDLVSMRLEKTVNLAPFLPVTATHFGGCYEKFTHSVVIMSDAGEIKYPLERYGADTVPLANVLSDLCLKVGLQNTDILTGDVSHALRGYVVSSRMAARDALQPLLGTFFVDAVETDGVLKFVPRGQTSVATVPYDDLGAAEANSGSTPATRLQETRKQDVELPQRIDLTHVDPDRDYQTNTQHASRITGVVPTLNKQSVQLSIALTANEAAQVADKTLTNAWVERNSYQLNLPPHYLRFDPTDVVTVATPEANFKLRLNQVDLGANNLLACQAVAEDELAYVSTVTGTGVALPSVPIGIAAPIDALLMDLPMLRADDDGLGLYYAFGIRNNSSQNATLYRAPDALAWSVVGTGIGDPAFGWAASVLADTARPWRWDETNSVQVALAQGTLDSKTALEVLNWANIALLGDEIIQWCNATLISANLYQLSGLLRGRRGTEDATGTHTVGERFVVLASGALYRTPMATTEVGNTAYYKALLSGGNWDDAPTVSQTYKGRSLRCLTPAHIKGGRDGSGNLTITWFRRPRWYGEWLDGVDAPLFEASEVYEVDVLNGTQIVRTLKVTSAMATYTAAQQTTDFGTVQSALSIAVYQLNAIIGRGIPGKAVI